jgi:anti-sigma B factor antagonist
VLPAKFTWERRSVDAAIEMFVLRGELDAAGAPPLRAQVRQLFEDGGRHCLLFDLTQVSFVDSIGLGLFFVAHRLCERSGGAVALACPQASVRGTLESTGLAGTLAVEPTRADAIMFLAREARQGAPEL